LVRDVFSFWQPLDSQWLRVLAKIAQHKHYSFVAPIWSPYFYQYLDYGDPKLNGLNAYELMNLANRLAFPKMQVDNYSNTGREYLRILREGL
jgi:hypothetical protein